MAEEKRLTVQGVKAATEAGQALFNAIPKARRLEHIGAFNELMLFLEASARKINSEADAKPGTDAKPV